MRVVDRGADRVTRELSRRGVRVDIGILGSDADEDHAGSDGMTVGDVAAAHEFGLGVPQRPFMRVWLESATAEVSEAFQRELAVVAEGTQDAERAAERVGLQLQGSAQAHLGTGVEPNAPATIAKKGSSVPLIDTGQLRSSISYRVTRL